MCLIRITKNMNVLESTENKMSKDKNGEYEPHLESTEVVLVTCNILNNIYQQNSRVLYTFVSNRSFGQLLKILLSNFIFLNTLNSEFLLRCIMV